MTISYYVEKMTYLSITIAHSNDMAADLSDKCFSLFADNIFSLLY